MTKIIYFNTRQLFLYSKDSQLARQSDRGKITFLYFTFNFKLRVPSHIHPLLKCQGLIITCRDQNVNMYIHVLKTYIIICVPNLLTAYCYICLCNSLSYQLLNSFTFHARIRYLQNCRYTNGLYYNLVPKNSLQMLQ